MGGNLHNGKRLLTHHGFKFLKLMRPMWTEICTYLWSMMTLDLSYKDNVRRVPPDTDISCELTLPPIRNLSWNSCNTTMSTSTAQVEYRRLGKTGLKVSVPIVRSLVDLDGLSNNFGFSGWRYELRDTRLGCESLVMVLWQCMGLSLTRGLEMGYRRRRKSDDSQSCLGPRHKYY